MIVVSSAVHIMAHYYNYERLTRYSPPNLLPPGEQADPPFAALPLEGDVGVRHIDTCYIGDLTATGVVLASIFHDLSYSLSYLSQLVQCTNCIMCYTLSELT